MANMTLASDVKNYSSGLNYTPAPVVTPTPKPVVTSPTPVVQNNTGYLYKGQDGQMYNSLAPGIPLTTPVTPVVTPPIDSAAGIASNTTPTYSYTLSPEDKASQEAAANYLATYGSDATQTIDPAAEYSKNLSMYQGQIDATNKIYADKLNTARIQGQGRMGSTTALEASRGLGGSNVANAMDNTQQDANNAEQNAIQNEQNAAIQAILGKVSESSLASIKEKTAAKKAGAEALLTYYDNKPTRDATALKPIIADLIKKGIDPATLSPADLLSITNGLGVSKESVLGAYNDALTTKKTSEATAAKAKAELDQTVSQTAKTTADTAMIGKMTPSEKANLAEKVREFGMTYALDKWKAENPTKAEVTGYTSATIPSDVKTTLLKDATAKGVTFAELSQAYPNVDTKYIADLLNNMNQ